MENEGGLYLVWEERYMLPGFAYNSRSYQKSLTPGWLRKTTRLITLAFGLTYGFLFYSHSSTGN